MLVFAFIGSGAIAEDTPLKMRDTAIIKMSTMMKPAKLMRMKQGDTMLMDSTATLHNSAMVNDRWNN